MASGKQILMGWGLVVSVTAAVLIGLPKLADASGSVKERARWQKRAAAFQTSGKVAISRSSTATNLAALHLESTIGNRWMRDAFIVRDRIAHARTTGREKLCLAEAVYYEARSESTAGQKAVAEVVLNRVRNRNFPDTICGVVYQGAERATGCQFSFTCDGSTTKLPRGKHWQQSQRIAEHMLIGASASLTRQATHYHTTAVNPEWSGTLRQTRQYGRHVFYRFMNRKTR